VEVIKEVENNEKLKMMGETLQKLRKDLSLKDKKIEELENINKQLESIKVSQGAVYLKGSNIIQKL
jgi:predicted RNase H-like nuclease (RuvC/YqgF family)